MKPTKGRLLQAATRDGVSARTVERDYAIAHVLARLGAHPDSDALVFKGGACLRWLHFEDGRYSADIDCSVQGLTQAEALPMIDEALRAAPSSPTDLQLELTDGEPPRIAYLGPLGKQRTLKLDLTDDEPVESAARRPLNRRWADLPHVEVLAYTPLESAAEKLRCVLQRVQCRDLLDLHRLLDRVDPFEVVARFERKARHRGFDPTTFSERYQARKQQYQARWESELSQYLGEVPSFRMLERELDRHLRHLGLL